MLNPLFFTSVSSFLIHAYLASTKNNSFLLLPTIGTITSIIHHDTNSKYNNHIQKLDKSTIIISVFWDFLWIFFSPISQDNKYISIRNIVLTILCYYSSNYIYKFYNYYYNIIGLQLHLLTHILATWSNATIFSLIDKEPDNILFKIGYLMCFLGTTNILLRCIFRMDHYPETYCTDYASKITSMIFQIIFCYYTIVTLFTTDKQFELNTINNIVLFIAYFCYDIISLLSTSRGSSQTMYLLHHIVSLYLISILYLSYTSNITLYYINILGFIFEVANPFLNTMKLLRSLLPDSILYYTFLDLSKLTYCISRIMILPILILMFYKDNISIINPYLFYQVIIGLTGMCFLSISWCTHLFAMNQ